MHSQLIYAKTGEMIMNWQVYYKVHDLCAEMST